MMPERLRSFDHRLWRYRLVDLFRGTRSLSCYDEYMRSQFLPVERIREAQLAKLQRLLIHAYSNCEYYRKMFDDLGMAPSAVRSLADFRALPFLTKELIRAHEQDIMARNRDAYRPVRKRTGGSTGSPLPFLMDRSSRSSQWATIFRQWNAGGWRFGDPLVYFFGAPVVSSPVYAAKRRAYARLNNWLLLSSFGITDESMDEWLRRIRRRKIRFMHAYASSASCLAQFARDRGFRDVRFTSVFTSAEPLYPVQREIIRDAFRCEVFDLYGANDGGGYAFECGEHDGLHCVTERALIEVLREDGSPAREGESGEIVSTDLLNYAMPFIRYRVGDIATVGSDSCACGRGLPKLRDVRGRSHDFVTTMTGEKVHGEYFSHLLRRIDWIIQFQVVQEQRDHLELRLRTRNIPDEHALHELQQTLAKKFCGTSVAVTQTGEIPVSPIGKFRYIINNTRGSSEKS